MNDVLTPNQMADLVVISEICAELEADLVLIGAMSLLVSMGALQRLALSRSTPTPASVRFA